MKYIVREIEIVYYHASSYFIEDFESETPVKAINHRLIGEFQTRKRIDVEDVVCMDGIFYLVDQRVSVTTPKERYVELFVMKYPHILPRNQIVYWPERDKKQICDWRGK